eukprot:g9115.t1
MNLGVKKPVLAENVWVAPNASVVGNVNLGKDSSVWYGAIIKGDESSVKIGDGTNIQDGATVGIGLTNSKDKSPTVIGRNVTIGHYATLTGCIVEDECLIGIGVVICHGVKMDQGAMLAAGAVVLSGTRIPPKQLWAGNPAVYKRDLKDQEISFLPVSARNYIELAQKHAAISAQLQKKVAESEPPFLSLDSRWFSLDECSIRSRERF